MERTQIVELVEQMSVMADRLEFEYNEYREKKMDWYEKLVDKLQKGDIGRKEFKQGWDMFFSGEMCTSIDRYFDQLRNVTKGLVASYDHFVKVQAKVDELYNKVNGGE